MGKRNKIRYQSEVKERKTLVLTGTVFLQYEDDDEAIRKAEVGDVLVYPQNEALTSIKQGDYRSRGFAGYFKVDVFEGKSWCPVLLGELFPNREHYFSKRDYPIDVFERCGEMLIALEGRTLVRTYREHYTLQDAEDTATV